MQKRFELMNFSVNNSLESLMQKMLDEITELIPSQIGFFHFMDEDESTPGEQMWSTKTLKLSKVPASEGHHRPLDEAGVWADAVRLRRPLIQNDYESQFEKKGLPEGHVSIKRNLIIPIIRNERIMAVLGIGNKIENYTQQDFEAAIRFADHAWDIVERKNMELTLADERNQLARRIEARTADLSRANSNLARALRVKDEFLANMSHELRTPLNAILGLSESLGEQTAGPLNEKQLRYINTIGESGHHLLSLINDILDLAKIEAGQITLNINKVDIKSICEASLRMVKQLAMKKNQSVELDIDDSVGLMWADERRLKQMLVNLLSNAVKFTPEDGRLGLEVRGNQMANQVSYTVWDNGIGIEDNDLSLLFQPFIQLDGGLDRENAGTGLGLVLVSQMARLHGGGVTVESLPKRGSRFTITLPWEPTLSPITTERLKDTGRLSPPNSDENYEATILIIEDTQEVTMMLRDYLESAGYQVVIAEDGLEGIKQAKLTHPALILMDIQMPLIDGFEATKRLRKEPEFEHTPIIALTALAMPNDRERCLAAGMDEYISKPVNLKVLLRIIKSHLLTAKDASKPQ
jgi:signal transduction histidine kinase/CheY-like chemotaxis protein